VGLKDQMYSLKSYDLSVLVNRSHKDLVDENLERDPEELYDCHRSCDSSGPCGI